MSGQESISFEQLYADEQQRADIEAWNDSFGTRMAEIKTQYMPLPLDNDEILERLKAQLDLELLEDGITLTEKEYKLELVEMTSDLRKREEAFRHFSDTLSIQAYIVTHMPDQSFENKNKVKKTNMMDITQRVKSGEYNLPIPYLEIADQMIEGEPLNLDEDSIEFKEYQELWLQQQAEGIVGEMQSEETTIKTFELCKWISELDGIDDSLHFDLSKIALIFTHLVSRMALVGGELQPAQKGNIIDTLRQELKELGLNIGLAETIFSKMVELAQAEPVNE